MENTRILLIAEMKRAIELLEMENALETNVPGESFKGHIFYKQNPNFTELSYKLREVRRDSVRLMKEIKAKK